MLKPIYGSSERRNGFLPWCPVFTEARQEEFVEFKQVWLFWQKKLVCKLYIEIRIYCIYFSNFSLHFCFCSYFFSLAVSSWEETVNVFLKVIYVLLHFIQYPVKRNFFTVTCLYYLNKVFILKLKETEWKFNFFFKSLF